jgi:aryl-alcohol dehydrogenase-like predicted oxidoreductase
MNKYCLGTALFGTKISEIEVNSLLDLFLNSGNQYLDTALFYADWLGGKSESEKVIGNYIDTKNCRKEVKIITKCCHPFIESPEIKRVNSQAILEDVSCSLKNLKTDYIDILMLHKDDVNCNFEEIVDTLEMLVANGKIKEYGFSNWSATRIENVIKYCTKKNYYGFTSLQLMWSLAKPNSNYFDVNEHVQYDSDFEKILKMQKLKIFAYSSLGRGVLSKLKNNNTLVRRSVYNAYFNYNNLAISNYISNKKLSLLSFEFGYLTSHKEAQVFPIIGVGNLQQLEQIVNTLPLDYCEKDFKIINQLRNKEINIFSKFYLKLKYKTFFNSKLLA